MASSCIEEKAIYSIEKFIVARRLMYWQVYLHRTVLSAEHMLMLVLNAPSIWHAKGLPCSLLLPCHCSCTTTSTGRNSWPTPMVLERFCELDDSDMFVAMKSWRHHDDRVLALLSQRLLDRGLFRIELRPEPFTEAEVRERVQRHCRCTLDCPQRKQNFSSATPALTTRPTSPKASTSSTRTAPCATSQKPTTTCTCRCSAVQLLAIPKNCRWRSLSFLCQPQWPLG